MNRIDDKNIGFVWRGMFFFACITFISFQSISQCKSYKLTDRGDTINCIDLKGKKQGPWLEAFPELRGNPGYEEEGEYLDGLKEGVWRRYTMQGDVLAVETYSWGLKNGKSMYYSFFGLEREESWWAINPKQKFDTIDVPDLYVDGNYRTVIVPNEGRSMRHGSWVVYNAQTGRIDKTEEYIRDSAVGVLGAMGITSKKSNSKSVPDSTGKKKDKPDVVQDWEKKNSGKKKIKVRDGSTGYN